MLLLSLLGSREARLSVENARDDPAASCRRTRVAYAPPTHTLTRYFRQRKVVESHPWILCRRHDVFDPHYARPHTTALCRMLKTCKGGDGSIESVQQGSSSQTIQMAFKADAYHLTAKLPLNLFACEHQACASMAISSTNTYLDPADPDAFPSPTPCRHPAPTLHQHSVLWRACGL